MKYELRKYATKVKKKGAVTLRWEKKQKTKEIDIASEVLVQAQACSCIARAQWEKVW